MKMHCLQSYYLKKFNLHLMSDRWLAPTHVPQIWLSLKKFGHPWFRQYSDPQGPKMCLKIAPKKDDIISMQLLPQDKVHPTTFHFLMAESNVSYLNREFLFLDWLLILFSVPIL